MDKIEARDIVLSVGVLTIAFSNLIHASIFTSLLASFMAVIFCFFTHELAHRGLAKYYGFSARYVAWSFGLFLALITSFFGFLFAAPGAVQISPYSEKFAFEVRPMTKREYGIIAFSGPAANIIGGICFALLWYFTGLWIFKIVAELSFWLAFFNLLPLPPLDGSKVLIWNPLIEIIGLVFSFIAWQVV